MLLFIIPLLVLAFRAMAMDNLEIAYEWKKLLFAYPTLLDEKEALQANDFKPVYNVPTGIEVYKDRLFIAIPRLRKGVPVSLAYINITETPSGSPYLHPYPNWETHNKAYDEPSQIVSPFKIRADRCGRLWVLDTGYIDILEAVPRLSQKPKILIYDLKTDQLLRTYTIPDDQTNHNKTGFVNIAVEDEDCQNSFAYLADIFGPSLVVYSYQAQKSWLVKHHYFHINPMAGQMNVGGVEFVWTEGIFGLALSRPDPEGYSTLYFHPIVSFDEFTVSTKVLRNESLATNMSANFHYFKRLGTRGEKGQSGVSYLDKKTNVIFFASINLNAVICWRTTNPNYTTDSHSRVFMSNETMVYPSDIKVDANDTLWVLSNKLPVFIHSVLDYNSYNFRILKGKVADAIKDTACDSKMVVNRTIVEKIKGVTRERPSSSSGVIVDLHRVCVVIIFTSVYMIR